MSGHNRRLTRSRDRRIFGVCGGIAEFVGWPASSVRALAIVSGLLTAVVPALILYGLFALAMPAPRAFNLDDFREQ